MNEFDELEADNTNIIFRDVILLALAGFMAVVIIMLAHINPPGKKNEADDAPGNLIVEINWDIERNIDVDLWLKAGGNKPIGYSNKSGPVWNLLRDDLGHHSDITRQNFEIAYTRGIVPGEYIINLHLYKIHDLDKSPIKVQVVISMKQIAGTIDRLWTSSMMLAFEGDQVTVTHLELSKLGKIVEGSMHDTPYNLREEINTSYQGGYP